MLVVTCTTCSALKICSRKLQLRTYRLTGGTSAWILWGRAHSCSPPTLMKMFIIFKVTSINYFDFMAFCSFLYYDVISTNKLFLRRYPLSLLNDTWRNTIIRQCCSCSQEKWTVDEFVFQDGSLNSSFPEVLLSTFGIIMYSHRTIISVKVCFLFACQL